MDDVPESYIIHIGGRWTLADLYIFPRTYEQVYFLMYSLRDDLDENQADRIKYAYQAFPWRGGYSAVSFYNQLMQSTPRASRPQINGIKYNSPGWIDLELIMYVAASVATIVASVAATIASVNSLYGSIIRGMQKRKLMQLEITSKEVRLSQEDAIFIEECARSMARALGFKSIEEINARTGHPYKTLKILLSLFRRVRTLVDFDRKGKAHLPPLPRKTPSDEA